MTVLNGETIGKTTKEFIDELLKIAEALQFLGANGADERVQELSALRQQLDAPISDTDSIGEGNDNKGY